MEQPANGRRTTRPGTHSPTPLTTRDADLLGFIAEHRFVLREHAAALLRVATRTADGRLRALTSIGALAREPPGCYRITSKGLGLVGSPLPRPRIDWRSYHHDVGLAWLWLAARAGVWGPVTQILSERSLRSRDAARSAGEEPFAVRLGGTGPGGRDRLHYPDLLLGTARVTRIALELELSAKGSRRRERILSGYGADRRIEVVVYLIDDPAIARSVRASARQLGLAGRLRLQPIRWSRTPQPPSPACVRSIPERARAATPLLSP